MAVLQDVLIALAALLSQEAKASLPAEADIKKAEQSIRQVLSKEYSSATSRLTQRALARKLLEQVAGAKDAAEKYALLRDALSYGATSLEFATFFKAAKQMTASFAVKPGELGIEGIAKAKKAMSGPDDAAAVTEACLALYVQAMITEEFEAAEKWTVEAERIAKGANDPGLLQAAKDLRLEAVETKKEATFTEFKGRYLCFVKDDWSSGLTLLAEDADEALKALAKREIAKPEGSSAVFELGKAWTAASEKMPAGLMKRRCAVRGRQLRDLAIRSAQGIEKIKLAKDGLPKVTFTKVTCANTDLTKELQEAFDRDPRRPVCFFDDYVVPNLPPDSPKSMLIEYDLGGRRVQEKPPARGIVVIPGVPPKGVFHPEASRRFEIISAYWGAGIRFVDVTDVALKVIDGPYTSVPGNIGGGDPCPGQVKVLILVYDLYGRRMTKAIREGETAILARD